MKKTSIIAFLAAAILVAGIITAGCTQDTGSGSAPAGNNQQYSPTSGNNNPPAENGGPQNSGTGSATYSQQYSQTGGDSSPPAGYNRSLSGGSGGGRQFSGQKKDLQNALNTTTNATSGRPDLSAAAQQLGISQQQLMDALGFPASGFRGRGNTTAPPAPVQ